jgi:SOS response regulatory protein OraA/RecX
LRRLRARDWFAAELRACLAETFDEATQQAVLERLSERGLVNDVRLARALVAANHGKRAVSLDELRRRLAELGASEAAIATLSDADEPSLEILLKRFERSEAGRARAYRYLSSRGFHEEVILSAIATHLQSES